MSDDHDAAVDAAWAYEQLHVPALFRQWADPMLDAAAVVAGHDVLDVACGTGALTRRAIARVGPYGSATGLDAAPSMLAVAHEIEPAARWVHGDASQLPFEDGEFDAVLCQFGLMFFEDRAGAVREMLRCTKQGGGVAVAVWEALARSEAYPISVDLLQRRAGQRAADALRAPFVLGDTMELEAVFRSAGASDVSIVTQVGTARFPSVRSMIEADLRGWLPALGVHLDEELIDELFIEADELLGPFVDEHGAMVFQAPAHIVTAHP